MLNALRFDERIRLAGRELQKRTICETLCQQDIHCRQKMLEYALIKYELVRYPYTQLEELKQELSKFTLAYWPSSDFSYPSSVIPDQDPFDPVESGFRLFRLDSQSNFNLATSLTQPPRQEELTFVDYPIFSDTLSQTFLNAPKSTNETHSSPRILLHGRSKLLEMPISASDEILDPIHPRPKINGINKTSASVIHFLVNNIGSSSSQCQILNRAAFGKIPNQFKDSKEVQQILQSPHVQSALRKTPWSDSDSLTQAILDTIQTGNQPQNLPLEPSQKDRLPVNLELKSKLQKTITHPFHTYCTSCHSPAGRNTLLPLENVEELKRYRSKNNESVLDRIKRENMPPAPYLKSLPLEMQTQWEHEKTRIIQAFSTLDPT
jgi:hypothetical protein